MFLEKEAYVKLVSLCAIKAIHQMLISVNAVTLCLFPGECRDIATLISYLEKEMEMLGRQNRTRAARSTTRS